MVILQMATTKIQNIMPASSNELNSNLFANAHFKYLFYVLTAFIGIWISSNIVAIKLVSIYGITLTGGFFTFPFTTMLGMVIVEVYGYKNIRQAIWSGVIINLIFLFSLLFVNTLPSSPEWKLGNEFKLILVPSIRILTASIVSFLAAEFINGYFMAKLKLKFGNNTNSLIARMMIACGSSFLLDIFLFLTIAYYGSISTSAFKSLLIIAYLKKVGCQLLLLPLSIYLIRQLKKIENIEISDHATKFTPLILITFTGSIINQRKSQEAT